MWFGRFYGHFAAAYGTLWLIAVIVGLIIQDDVNLGPFGLFGFPLISLIYAFSRMRGDVFVGSMYDQARLLIDERCPTCQYPLFGLPSPGACPECGFAFDQHTLLWGKRNKAGKYERFVAVTPTGIVIHRDGTSRTVVWKDLRGLSSWPPYVSPTMSVAISLDGMFRNPDEARSFQAVVNKAVERYHPPDADLHNIDNEIARSGNVPASPLDAPNPDRIDDSGPPK